MYTKMGLPSVMVLPLLIVVFAGVYYVYNKVMRFMSKSMVLNKVVVITDAISGMGSECARLFHEGGARLVLCGPSWDKLESLHDSLCSGSDPSKTFTPKLVLLDFSDMENISDVITEIAECYGCVDVLICNSSMKVKAPVQNHSLEMDKTVMDVNYFGPITLAKGVLPLMITRRTGQFVLANSIQGTLALPFRTSYAASKHAVQAFFDCLRAEVEEYGISVSTVSHTFINSQNTTPSKTPPTNPLWAYISCMLNSHGVSPNDLAREIVRTVNRHRREVLLAHPIPWIALYIRSLLPSFFFAVVAAGVKDGAMAEQLK
ncbi:dehydrogenase/reductase SDR family member 7C-A-like isoform X1 [Xyrauchen texanus]|uniref:dehydrogenase/reductase SDR family member 7C-A-like isoform X1 n=1 Tax=Xyrauchen texanus TaxID=154827 RepID=UPI00224254B3|nr:dehydrogenase/reductase SDR family member 7C-A-like isoform X1 [Xyrauchen texanus]